MSISSVKEETTGQRAATPKDDVQYRANVAARARVPAQRVHLEAEKVRAGPKSKADGNADQNLVSKPAGKGQADREGAAGCHHAVSYIVECNMVSIDLLRLSRSKDITYILRNDCKMLYSGHFSQVDLIFWLTRKKTEYDVRRKRKQRWRDLFCFLWIQKNR